jgi:hypothetical protein
MTTTTTTTTTEQKYTVKESLQHAPAGLMRTDDKLSVDAALEAIRALTPTTYVRPMDVAANVVETLGEEIKKQVDAGVSFSKLSEALCGSMFKDSGFRITRSMLRGAMVKKYPDLKAGKPGPKKTTAKKAAKK